MADIKELLERAANTESVAPDVDAIIRRGARARRTRSMLIAGGAAAVVAVSATVFAWSGGDQETRVATGRSSPARSITCDFEFEPQRGDEQTQSVSVPLADPPNEEQVDFDGLGAVVRVGEPLEQRRRETLQFNVTVTGEASELQQSPDGDLPPGVLSIHGPSAIFLDVAAPGDTVASGSSFGRAGTIEWQCAAQ